MAEETRDAEIARTEGELTRLKSRYANLKRSTRYILPFCILTGALIAWFLVHSWIAGDTAAVVTAIAILLALIGLAFASRHDRFVVWASSPDSDMLYPHGNYAKFLEHAIADRERRLAELRSKS
jgi:uncharacterized membrane protein